MIGCLLADAEAEEKIGWSFLLQPTNKTVKLPHASLACGRVKQLDARAAHARGLLLQGHALTRSVHGERVTTAAISLVL
jgi:hypothetical protein